MGETVKKAKETKPKKNWFKGLKQEFKKIIWPDRKSLSREAVAVLSVSVALGVIISVVDLLIRLGIEFLIK